MSACRALATPTVLGGAPRAAPGPPAPPRGPLPPPLLVATGPPAFPPDGVGRCVRYHASATIAASTISAMRLPRLRPRRETAVRCAGSGGAPDDDEGSIECPVTRSRSSCRHCLRARRTAASVP